MADPNFQPYVVIDGVRAAMHKQDVVTGQPTVMDGIQIPWGRNTIVDQPDTSLSPTFRVRQRLGFAGTPSLFDVCHSGATVQIWATGIPALGVPDRLMWAGEIGSAKVQPTDPYAIEAPVICVDASASLGNIDIGDEPWPEETAYARFQRILAAASAQIRDLRPTAPPGPDWRWNLTGDMDETIKSLMIAFRDVDSQPALGLIQDLAKSVGGIAWITADSAGQSIWIEDPTQRQGLRELVIDPVTGEVTIGQIPLDLVGVNEWKRSEIIPADPEWSTDPSQSMNVINVTFRRRDGVNDQGNPAYTDTKVTVTDPSNKGIRAFDVDTDLIKDVDAHMLASRWLAQSQTADWIVDGFAVDSAKVTRNAAAAAQFARVMDLLDVRTRIGYRITVIEMPDWSPTGTQQSYYLEGGTYTWSNSRWQLELIGSANAVGSSAKFSDFPHSATMADFAPTIRGRDLLGVAAPGVIAAGFGGGFFGVNPFGE